MATMAAASVTSARAFNRSLVDARAASASGGKGCACPGSGFCARASRGRQRHGRGTSLTCSAVVRSATYGGSCASAAVPSAAWTIHHIRCPPLIQEPSGRPPRNGLSNPLQAAIAMRHSCGRCLWMRAKVPIYLGWHAVPVTGIGEILEAHPESLQRYIQLGRKLRRTPPVCRWAN